MSIGLSGIRHQAASSRLVGLERHVVYEEVISALARALSVAQAFREFADDAVGVGKLARPMASAMHRSAAGAATQMHAALSHQDLPEIPAELLKCLKDGIVDLETLGELANLAVSHDLTPKNALHLAHGLRYTAEKTAETLQRASALLRDACG
jgi:hypothetical protein